MVKRWKAALFEEPHLFLHSIKERYSEGYRYSPLESDAQIRSQIEHSKRSPDVSGSMGKSTKFSIPQGFVLEIRYLLASSPPTELVLERCTIDQEMADVLTQVIQDCTTLNSIKIADCKKDSSDISPILLAISESTSIRNFTFEHDGQNLDFREFDSILRLIRLSRTLRRLELNDIFCSISHICRALDALRSNTSILWFDCLMSLELPPWPETSEMEEETLNTVLVELISHNKTLTKIFLSVAVKKGYPILRQDALLEAFNKNVSLSSMSLKDRRIHDGSVEGYRSFPEARFVNDLAAIVFKIGRVLSGESLVCGQSLPIELVEEIMKQVTIESVWDDKLWKPIRRVAVNRRTIGRLLTNDETFDAYELLYRCRSLA